MGHYLGLPEKPLKQLVWNRLATFDPQAPFAGAESEADLESLVVRTPAPQGEFPQLLYEAIDVACDRIGTRVAQAYNGLVAPDVVEGEAAEMLYDAVSRYLPSTPILDQDAFWAYLTVRYFWSFTVWRYAPSFEALARHHPENRRLRLSNENSEDLRKDKKKREDRVWAYLDGSDHRDCVALRLFLRIQSVGGTAKADYGSKLEEDSVDFWHSTILQRRIGEYPAITRAIVDLQLAARLNTELLRTFARDLNRVLANIDLDMLSEEEQAAIAIELWSQQLTPGTVSAAP